MDFMVFFKMMQDKLGVCQKNEIIYSGNCKIIAIFCV
jgi:hypothetical protein